MSATSGYDEERLGELLSDLPRLPLAGFRLRRSCRRHAVGIDEIVERARVDSEFRVRLVADLEAALAAAGYEPTDELVDAVRACLPELDQ